MNTKLLGLIVAAASIASAAPITIDNFTSGAINATVLFGGINPVTQTAGAAGSGMIGGARSISLTRTGGNSLDFINVDTTSNTLDFNTANNDNAFGITIWDADTTATLNPLGLGGQDITAAGSNIYLHIRAKSDIPQGVVTMVFFTNATSYSSISFTPPGNGTSSVVPWSDYYLLFSTATQGAPALFQTALGLGAATGAANFANIGAIAMFIDGTSSGATSLDASFQLIESTGAPEPATFVLLGAGLVGFAILRRKKA